MITGVDGFATSRAESAHAAVLEHREQFGLERQRQQPDLVEEQGPAVGHLKESRLRVPGIGEGPALVAE